MYYHLLAFKTVVGTYCRWKIFSINRIKAPFVHTEIITVLLHLDIASIGGQVINMACAYSKDSGCIGCFCSTSTVHTDGHIGTVS